VVVDDFAVRSIGNDFSFFLKFGVFISSVLCESPFARNDDLLTTRELELGATESFDDVVRVRVFASNGNQNLSDANASNSSVGFSKGATHSSLESISSGTRKHFINSQHMPRVNADSHVEGVLSGHLCDVLVRANAGGFEGFGGNLFDFSRQHVNTAGKFVDEGLLTSKIVDAKTRIRDTTTETGLNVRFAPTITITSCRPSTHWR